MRFTPQKAVTWFDPAILAKAALKLVISSTFGNYADKREFFPIWDAIFFDLSGEKPDVVAIPTKLAKSAQEVEDLWQNIPTTPTERGDAREYWVDYLSDTGDGFDATYTMAQLVGQKELAVGDHILPRANVLVLGGDEVYPDAEREEYRNRFTGPFDTAYPDDDSKESPFMFAIPGNHDWYDGLTNFMKLFCQRRKIGKWKTLQQYSYFAIRLPHDVWVWGIDVQLASDIDEAQLRYFDRIIQNPAFEKGKVILCTAEPAWVRCATQAVDSSYDRLKLFEERCLKGNGKFELLAVLTGDLHHYSRYECEAETGEKFSRITAGGGGAFLHPTHNLPRDFALHYYRKEKKEFVRTQETGRLKAEFPSQPESKNLAFRNFAFPYFNYTFVLLFITIFTLLGLWMPVKASIEPFSSAFFPHIVQIFLLLIGVGLVFFTDILKTKKFYLWGAIHGLGHIGLFVGLACLWGSLWNTRDEGWLREIGFALSLGITAGLGSGLLMGIYLFISTYFLGIHDNEGFSSFKCEDYKSFLRLHLSPTQLTIYPIGVREVTRWKPHPASTPDHPKFEGKKATPFLIEAPIVIPLGGEHKQI